jgi:hypothetical protein
MSNELPYWHRLIAAWLGRGGYGLTIPFVVGAGLWHAGRKQGAEADIDALLVEIVNRPVPGFALYARWCDDMQAVVLATYKMDFQYRPTYNLIEFFPQDGGALSMASEASLATRLGVKSSPNSLREVLIQQALPHVEQGNFSRFWTIDGRQNGPFQPDDLEFIKEALRESAA